MLILNQDWHFWNLDPKTHFLGNLRPKLLTRPFCLKISVHSVATMVILNLDLDFWYLNPQIHFSANLGEKIRSCWFCLKIDAHSISRMLIPNLDLNFLNQKSILMQIWAQTLKVVRFVWKLVHIVSPGCWFRMQTYIFAISSPKFLFGEIWTKKFKVVCVAWKLVQTVYERCWVQIQA